MSTRGDDRVETAGDVELRDVRKVFGETVAVNGVSLRIGRGEFFSLLGPSGCGKTTTLRMIAGFEHPSGGEVAIQGRAMGETPPFARAVNTVFQHYALFPHMNVAENVAFGLEMKRVPRREAAARVDEALALVHLAGYGARRPKQLSGGQQQRVALARALVNRPAVLLLDEPLGALDLKLRREMQLELKRLNREVGVTFVYVTHDQEEALTMSDRLAVMDRGRVLQVGSPEEIYDRPANRFVADFIGESNFLEGEVEATGGGRIRVAIDGGLDVDLPADAAPAGVRPGQRVAVAVRPERIRLTPAAADRLGGWHGWVEEELYVGTDTNLLVRLPAGQIVRVRQRNDGGPRDALPPRSAVGLAWAPESARLLVE